MLLAFHLVKAVIVNVKRGIMSQKKRCVFLKTLIDQEDGVKGVDTLAMLSILACIVQN
jgi:hypothetical protein